MTEVGSPEWVRKVATGAAASVVKLVAFAKAVHKLKLGASGGRVTLNKEDCDALIWGLRLLKDYPHKEAKEPDEAEHPRP